MPEVDESVNGFDHGIPPPAHQRPIMGSSEGAAEREAQAAAQTLLLSLMTATGEDREGALRDAAYEIGRLVRHELLDKQLWVNSLRAAAVRAELVADHGEGPVHELMAAAFAEGERATVEDLTIEAETIKGPARGTQRQPSRAGRRSAEVEVRQLVSRRLSEVQMRAIEWVWFGRIAVGKHTTLAGEPGIGKSTVLYWIAAAISTGGPWPCGEGTALKGSVIILSAEDGAEDTIAPRVAAAGGDRSKVHVITATRDDEGNVSSFTLQSDLQALEKLIGEIGDVRLVIIDPISSYLGEKVDGHSNTDIRRVVEPLHEMADRLKVAVLTNTHFAKSGATNKSRATHRVIGSTAFIALPRVVLAVTVDPENEDRRLVLHLKNNIAKPAPGLAFTLVQAKAGDIGEPPVELYASRVDWEPEHVSTTADQAIAGHEAKLRSDAAEKRPSPDRDEAEVFLRDILADGPKAAREVREAAEAAGIKDKPLREARERLVESVQERSNDRRVIRGFLWKLKAEAATGCAS